MTEKCTICKVETDKKLFTKDRFEIYECTECRHRFIGESSLKGFDFDNFYKSNYKGFRHDDYFQEVLKTELNEKFIPRIAPPANILDLGCGNGDFLLISEANGYSTTGVDISKDAVEYCVSKGLKAQTFDDFNDKTDHYDFVTMWDVIEHVPDPNEIVKQAYLNLKNEGVLVIKTPLHSKKTFNLLKVFSKPAKSMLQLPAHIQFYTEQSLVSLLESNGFSIDEIHFINNMRLPKKKSGLLNKMKLLLKKSIRTYLADTNIYIFAKKSKA